jgi:hypothetical protein
MPGPRGIRAISSIGEIGLEIASTENGSWKGSGGRNHKVTQSKGSEHFDGREDHGKDVPLETFKVREVHIPKRSVEDGESLLGRRCK